MDSDGNVHLSLVTSKTKVATPDNSPSRTVRCSPARAIASSRPTSVRSATQLRSRLDRQYYCKTYVGNRVSHTVELIPPDRWNHVVGTDKPADCASRGLFPSELVNHELWWNGPDWLKLPSTERPKQSTVPELPEPSDEEREGCIHSITQQRTPVIALDRYSSYT